MILRIGVALLILVGLILISASATVQAQNNLKTAQDAALDYIAKTYHIPVERLKEETRGRCV
jgi:hypothetical protein